MQVADLRLQWALLPQFQSDKSRTTDAWNAGPSTAGQRALRLAGAEDWAPVYSSSQTIAASSSQALKMVLSSLHRFEQPLALPCWQEGQADVLPLGSHCSDRPGCGSTV